MKKVAILLRLKKRDEGHKILDKNKKCFIAVQKGRYYDN